MKTVIVFFVKDIHSSYHIIWYVSFALIAPVFWTFIYIKLTKAKVFKSKLLLHFILPTIILIQMIFYPDLISERILHISIIILLVGYSIIAGIQIRKSRRSNSKYDYKWLVLFTFWLSIFPLIHLSPYIVRFNFLNLESLFYSISIYFFIYYELKNRGFRKTSSSNIQHDDLRKLYDKLNFLISNEELYLDPNLNLNQISQSLKVTPNQVSKAVNDFSGTNFNTYINNWRVKHAKRLLIDPKFSNQKISSIAYECGFNSLSVFNSSFKKIVGRTPTVYQSEKLCSES